MSAFEIQPLEFPLHRNPKLMASPEKHVTWNVFVIVNIQNAEKISARKDKTKPSICGMGGLSLLWQKSLFLYSYCVCVSR